MATSQASATTPIVNEPNLQRVGALPSSQPPLYYASTTTLTTSGNAPPRPTSAAGLPISPNPSTFTWLVTAAAANTQTPGSP